MRDQERPDEVATAILDHLVGRQIESRAWPAPPDDRPAADAPDAPPADDPDANPDAVAGPPEPVSPAADDPFAVGPDAAAFAEPGVDPIASEALALRSLLTECATLLQWVCTKAERGSLTRADVASAKAFLAMSELPPPANIAPPPG